VIVGRKPDSSSQFLRTGLRLLRSEFPDRHSAMCELLATTPGTYEVGDERFTVTAAEGRISVQKARSRKKARVQATLAPDSIIAVVDGTRTISEVLALEQFVVIADADALLTLSEVVRLVAESAIRSSRLQRLFEDYREWVRRQRG